MNAKLTAGQTVKYSNPQKGEEGFRFILLDIGDGRATIQLICNMSIRPIEVVADCEICGE